jgi:hypothetical protein
MHETERLTYSVEQAGALLGLSRGAAYEAASRATCRYCGSAGESLCRRLRWSECSNRLPGASLRVSRRCSPPLSLQSSKRVLSALHFSGVSSAANGLSDAASIAL